jgi:hypothetical protein
MWTDDERQEINLAVDQSWDRVKQLKITPDFVIKRLPHEYPELWSKTLKIEEELTPKVPFQKAMAMITSWEMTWRQIEMKLQKRSGRKKNGSSR